MPETRDAKPLVSISLTLNVGRQTMPIGTFQLAGESADAIAKAKLMDELIQHLRQLCNKTE